MIQSIVLSGIFFITSRQSPQIILLMKSSGYFIISSPEPSDFSPPRLIFHMKANFSLHINSITMPATGILSDSIPVNTKFLCYFVYHSSVVPHFFNLLFFPFVYFWHIPTRLNSFVYYNNSSNLPNFLKALICRKRYNFPFGTSTTLDMLLLG